MTYLYNDPIARAQFHAQAAATMGVDPQWDRAVANLIACEVRCRADGEYGPLELARQRRASETAVMIERFGQNWRNHPEGEPVWEAHAAAIRLEERETEAKFYVPSWESCRQLVATPAPSLSAVAFKAAVIEIHEVWNDSLFKGDCIAILNGDLDRVTGGLFRPENGK